MFSNEWKHLLLITIIFISACIETDIYLPAFTDMMAYFAISESGIQGLLTWNFIGMCLSGPFYGPISDSIGRKKPLMVALGLFLLGSILTLFAHNFEWMLIGRILQGLGSGGCFTLGTAVIFDTFKAEHAIQAINKLNSFVPIIMAGAPMLGGFLNETYGFRSNFLAITLFVLASFLISWFFLEEPHPVEKRVPLHVKKVLQDFKQVFLSVPFWQATVIVSLAFAGYLAFLSGISILFVIEYGVSKHLLPYFQASLLGFWVIASLTSKRAIKTWGNQKIKQIGTWLMLVGFIGLVLATWITPEDPYLLTLPMLFYSFGVNWAQGLYFPECMDYFPDIKGITASLLTSARLLITAAVVGIASGLYDSTIYPISGVVCGSILVTLITIYFYERKKVLVGVQEAS